MLFQKIYPLIIVIIVILMSCEKEVNIPNDNNQYDWVLNAVLKQDSAINASVSKSNNILSSNIEYEEVKYVLCLKNGFIIDTLSPFISANKIMYKSNFIPEPKTNYTIEAILKNEEKVSGSDQIPEKPLVFSSPLTHLLINGELNTELNLKLPPHQDEDRYYLIQLFSTDTTSDLQQYEFDIADETSVYEERLLLKQYFINIQSSYTDSFQIKLWVPEKLNVVQLNISSLSKHSYLYLSDIYYNEYFQNDISFTPKKVHSNITNGFGIVGGISERKIVIR